MIKEWADALGIDERMIYALIALLIIITVYSYNNTAGIILTIIAILTIYTSEWNKNE
jgi:hypothetical protein